MVKAGFNPCRLPSLWVFSCGAVTVRRPSGMQRASKADLAFRAAPSPPLPSLPFPWRRKTPFPSLLFPSHFQLLQAQKAQKGKKEENIDQGEGERRPELGRAGKRRRQQQHLQGKPSRAQPSPHVSWHSASSILFLLRKEGNKEGIF